MDSKLFYSKINVALFFKDLFFLLGKEGDERERESKKEIFPLLVNS